MTEKLKVLFLCTGNSCRSQMAEGLCRHECGELIEPYSAGIETHGLNPLAVRAMQELDIDISSQHSKTVDDLGSVVFDYVITVCGHANETCPLFRRDVTVIHQGFDDPPKLAANAKTDDEALVHYQRVRDEIRAYVRQLPELL